MKRKIVLLLACLCVVLSGCSLNKTTENNDKVNDSNNSNNSNESNVSSNWEDKVKDVEMKDVLLGYEVDGEYRGYLKLKLPVDGYFSAIGDNRSTIVDKKITELDGSEEINGVIINSNDFSGIVSGSLDEANNHGNYEETRDLVLNNTKETNASSDISLKEGELDGRRWFVMTWGDNYNLWIQLDNYIYFVGTWDCSSNCIFSNDEIHEYFMDSITFVE